MRCANCGHEGREGERFCASCGTALAPVEAFATTEAPPAPEPGPAIVETTEAGPVAAAAPPHAPDFVASSPAVPAWAPAAAPRLEYAGFWRRFVALAVDSLVLFFPQALVRVALGLPALSFGDEWGDTTVLRAELTGVGIGLLYATLFEGSAARGTPGQRLLGLYVADLRGGRIGFGRALARQFAKIVSALMCGLGYLVQLWNGRRQTLHDLMCGVVVLRGDTAVAGEAAAPGAMVTP